MNLKVRGFAFSSILTHEARDTKNDTTSEMIVTF